MARPLSADDTASTKPRESKPGATLHPLGPLVYVVEARRKVFARLAAALVLLGCVVLLLVGAWLRPDPTGLGTHRQFGLPPCTMVVIVGYPCPTCGMTTAFAHAVRGELLAAFNAQPAGLVFAVATVVAAAVSLGVLLTGKVWAVNWYRVSPVRLVIGAVLLILGGWGYKILVGLLTGALPIETTLFHA